jgi:hypothetical protein
MRSGEIMKSIPVLAIIILSLSTVAWGNMSQQDEIRLNGYASVIGRGMGCGLNMDAQMYRLFQWLEVSYREESPVYAEDFITVAAQNAQRQKMGEFPEDCSQVQEIISRIIWP